LVERVTRMRGRVRAVIGLFGIGVIIAAAVGGMVLLMFADYFLHFGNGLRVVLLLAWLVGLGVVAWKVLISPLSTRLTDQFLASRVENIHKDLADELISAVHFIHSGTIRTNALAARHVDAAEEKTRAIRFEEAVDFKRSSKAAGIAALAVLIAVVIAALNPAGAKIALSRWFSANPMVWPHTTHVEFAWPEGEQPAVIPIGEQFLVRAKVVQGGYANQRVWLTSWSDSKQATSELMTYQPSMSSATEFVYEKTLEPEGERTLSLKLQAGDDTEQGAVEIRLAARPVVRELTAAIAPPSYVKDVKDPSKAPPTVMVDLLSQAGRAVEGATVSLNIRSTKPFMLDGEGRPEVRLLDQIKDVELVQGMKRELLAADTARVTFPATKPLQARLSVRDTDGFDNRAGGTISLDVVPDGLPSVVLTEPKRLAERNPTGVVEIAIQGTDDLGLDGLKLLAEKFDAKPGDPPVFETPIVWAERTVDAAVGSTSGRATYTWELAPLKLQAGARLSFYAMVQDNYEVSGPPPKRHPWVKSAPLTLQILSQADLEKQFRDQMNHVKEQIKTLKNEQEKTQARTDVIQKAAAESGVTTAQQKQQLAELSAQQNQEAATGMQIAQKVEQLKEDLKQNKMSESDLGKIAENVAAGMKDVGGNNMPKAATELHKAQDSAGNKNPSSGAKQDAQSKAQAKQTAESAQNASKQQGEAIAKMNDMIQQLGAAGDLQAALSALRDIKDAQSKVDEGTQKFGRDNAGKNISELSPQAKKEMEKLAQDQKELSQKTSDVISQMKRSAEQQKQSDPAASQSMSQAAKSGEQNNVAGSQSEASSDIKKNQTSSASGNQTQAQNGLQQMIDELSKNDKRELEQLQRQLADLIQEVKKLKEGEETLNKDTEAAGDKAAAAAATKLGDAQGTLQMNTIVIQKKAENTRDAQKAAADIRDAGEQMGNAAGPLYANKLASAIEPEKKAIASLEEAIKKLQKQKNKIDDQLKDKQLAEFIKQYETIKTAQEGIKTFSDQVETKRQAAIDKQIDRRSTMALAEKSKTQQTLIDDVVKLSTDEELKKYDVIVWMNSQITQAMAVSRDDMAKAQTGTRLAMAQQTAIDRLADVIQALKEEKQKEKQFEDENSGGGGGGGGGKKPLLPPVAQLKLIKAMQNVINSQTVNVNKEIQSAKDDAEKSQMQEEAQKVGKTQGDLKKITEKVLKDMQQGAL
jgi:hypothetical protein